MFTPVPVMVFRYDLHYIPSAENVLRRYPLGVEPRRRVAGKVLYPDYFSKYDFRREEVGNPGRNKYFLSQYRG